MKDNITKYASALSQAATLIEKSAAEIGALRNERDNLQIQNARLQLSLTALERSKRSQDLAELMFKKGMISRGDVLTKAKEIMTYDDKAFQILKETVEATPSKVSDDSAFSVDQSEMSKEIVNNYDRSEDSKTKTVSKILSV